MSDGITLDVLNTTEALEALQPQLIALWNADQGATPFQHPAWLLPWWHHFSQPDLRVLTVCRDASLLAVLPMYVYREPVTGERQLLLLGAGTSDYLDGIFSPECRSEYLVQGLEHLREDSCWEVAHFTQLRKGSLLLQALENLHAPENTVYPGERCSRCPAVLIADLPHKVRADVRYFRNAALGQGTLELQMANEQDWQQAFERLVQFHTGRWEQVGEPGVLADPAVLAWHREAIPGLLAHGLLRLATLQLGDESVAVLYSLVDPLARAERTQYFYLTGFRTARAEFQPGTLLTAMAMERAAREGVRTIDMLRGEESYKRFWRATPVATHGFAVRRG